ncbi:APC family permease [Paenibacillus tarimensis]|uniref:APC family permease n=1 Tax=Paenibacillus tarimensis TaxID=416012 RepID=UPI001F28D45D|nr:APC family permease [Paenibacillus tarimensis]MCF2942718.1 APC family permease [Paenibacillus tarimensis]
MGITLAGLLVFSFVCIVIAVLGWRAGSRETGWGHYTGGTPLYIRFIEDKQQLNRMGYPQQLNRRIGALSSFGLSFSSMSVLGGAVICLGPVLSYVGPAGFGFGWPIAAFFAVMLYTAKAELASACPLAGGPYHWTKKLAGGWAGNVIGWLLLGGQMTLVVVANGVAALLITNLVPALSESSWRLAFMLAIAVLLTGLQMACHIFGSSAVSRLPAAGIWIQTAAVIAVVTCVVWLGDIDRIDAGRLFQTADGEDISLYSGAAALLLLMRMFLGADTAAYAAEETAEPGRQVPWSMFLSVSYQYIFGFVCFIFCMLALMHPVLRSAGYTDLVTVASTIGSFSGFGITLQSLIIGAALYGLWLGGYNGIFASSRLLFAMARDRAFPAASLVSQVSSRFHAPVKATLISGIIVIALLMAVLLGDKGFELQTIMTMTACTTGLSYSTYGVLMILHLLRFDEEADRGCFHMGKWSRPIASAGLLWCGAAAAVSCWIGGMTVIYMLFICLSAATAAVLGAGRGEGRKAYRTSRAVPERSRLLAEERNYIYFS